MIIMDNRGGEGIIIEKQEVFSRYSGIRRRARNGALLYYENRRKKHIHKMMCCASTDNRSFFFFVCGGECESRQKKTGEIKKVRKKEEHTC